MQPERHSPPVSRLPDGTWRLSPTVHGITDDSRTVQSGDLFVAVRGERADGHLHLAEAALRGAIAAVVEDQAAAAESGGLPLIVVHSSRRALGELASTWYGHPTRELLMVGVTGTNGKTTAAVMLAAILNAAGRPARSLGTLGPFSVGPGYPLTTPFPLQLQHTLRNFVQGGTQAVAMEVSSHGLTQHRVAGCEFDAAVLTSLGRDHLDYHRTIKAYWAAKTRLFKHLSTQTWHKEGAPVAVLPASGDGADTVARHVRVTCLRFGLEGEGDVRARDIQPTPWGSRFHLEHGGRSWPVRVHLPGRFNVENALAAAAAALALGVDGSAVVTGLERLRRVPGRCERLPLPLGGFAVVDYAHNPDGLARLLAAIREGAPGRRIVCVFGGRGHRDPGKLPGMGEVAARLADALVLTSDSPLDEDPRALAAAIQDGVPVASDLFVEFVSDREAAIERAMRIAGAGGAVVVTGRGHEVQQWIGGTVLERTDSDMVRRAAQRAFAGGAMAPVPPDLGKTSGRRSRPPRV
jgi:UDP-N-acetylmuramoyl-L-alanyl-D-glutamate--2,6-diaminopimelate ligase